FRQDRFRKTPLAGIHFTRPPSVAAAALPHRCQQIGPGIQRQRRQNIAVRQMMLEGPALGSSQPARWLPMQIIIEVPLAIVCHTVAKNEILHSATNIDWIDLNKPVMIQCRTDADSRLIEQQSAPMKSPRIEN